MAKGLKTGGRQAGTPNKATAEIRVLARSFAPDAVKELARIMTTSESDAARVAAIRELLDRGYGKAAQPITGEEGQGPVGHRVELVIVDPAGQPVSPRASTPAAIGA